MTLNISDLLSVKAVVAAGLAVALVVGISEKQIRTRIFLAAIAVLVASPGLVDILPGDPDHVGIATGALRVSAFAPVLLIALVTTRGRLPGWISMAFASLFIELVVGLAFWGFSARTLSGAVLLVLIWAAFVLGVKAAASGWMQGLRYLRLTRTIAALATFELVLCIAQYSGHEIRIAPRPLNAFEASRAFGSFAHPSTLGKFCLLWLILALPGLNSSHRSQRRTSAYVLVSCILCSGLTEARANTAAVVGGVLIWFLVQNSSIRDKGATTISSRQRLVVAALALIVAIPALATALGRFESDSGGDRAHFMEVGLPYVRANVVGGLGVNSYVEVVGDGDALTAEGYPIHNTFLLIIAEVGIVIATTFFLPFVAVLVLALRHMWRPGLSGDWSRSYLACLPGLVVIAVTGWGLVADTTGVCWFLVMGLVYGAIGITTPMTDEDRALSLAIRAGR